MEDTSLSVQLLGSGGFCNYSFHMYDNSYVKKEGNNELPCERTPGLVSFKKERLEIKRHNHTTGSRLDHVQA